MRAIKGNKEYTIDETQQKFYQDSGFDILNGAGAVVAYGRGKTVPYDEHMKAVSEIERLQILAAGLMAENENLNTVPEGLEMPSPEAAPAEPGEKKAGRKEADKKAGE